MVVAVAVGVAVGDPVGVAVAVGVAVGVEVASVKAKAPQLPGVLLAALGMLEGAFGATA